MHGPEGVERLDQLFAFLACTIRQCFGDKDVTVEDCMPQWGESEPSYDELSEKFHGLAAALAEDVPEWAK